MLGLENTRKLVQAGRYDDALTRDPWHLYAQELKTGLLLQLGYHSLAVGSAERLVSIERFRPESHLFLAFAYAFNGDEIDAIEQARLCKTISPERGFSHQALTVVHTVAMRWELAERHAIAAMRIEGPSAPLFHDLGIALENQGRFGEARHALAVAGEIDPRFTGAVAEFNRRQLVPDVIRKFLRNKGSRSILKSITLR